MRDNRETLDKENKKLKLKKIAKKQKIQERGITLIALVVTIIILLILAGVTLNIALSDNGLFSKAKKAAEDYKQAQSEEEDLISQFATQMYSEYVGAYVDGFTINSNTFTINGDTSGLTSNDDTDENVQEDGTQTFTTETDMKWQVWDYDGNTVRLISEKPTEAKLYLKGATGYNNGVYAINEICRQCYGKIKIDEKEVSTEVANLRRSDIQKVSTYDYTESKHACNSTEWWTEVIGDNEDEGKKLLQYGEATLSENKGDKVPAMWSNHDSKWTYEYNITNGKTGRNVDGEDPWEQEFGYQNENGKNELQVGTTVKEAYYNHSYKKNEFVNEEYYNLTFAAFYDGVNSRAGYWLPTRYATLGYSSDEASYSFGLENLDRGNNGWTISACGLYRSYDKDILDWSFLRPIISVDLKANGLSLEKVDDTHYKLE